MSSECLSNALWEAMDTTRPRAFLSYTRQDQETADLVAAQLEQAGFEVWFMAGGTSMGLRWQDEYEKRLSESRLLVAVVSMRYLAQPQCRNEVSIAESSFVGTGALLIAPIVIEPIDAVALQQDEAAALAYGRLMRYAGLADGRRPDGEELKEFAKMLAENARAIFRSPRANDGGDHAEQEGQRPEAILPLVEVWSRDRSRVTLRLIRGAPGAKTVQRWLCRSDVRPKGPDQWELDGKRYDSVIRSKLQSLLQRTVDQKGGADA